MNQVQIQRQTIKEERMLEKAEAIAETKRIKRHGKNVWCVQSANERTPNDFYVVTYDTLLDAFMCTCKAFSFSTGMCKHLCAVALFERRAEEEKRGAGVL
jgi:hypothetical protein